MVNSTQNKEENFLQEGDVITIKAGMNVSTQVPEMFVYSNRRDSKKLTTTTVKVGEVLDNGNGETFNTKKFAGSYVVEKTEFTGGGTGHGPGDVYPDGHHVTATKLKKDNQYSATGIQVQFYQSGAFNCMVLPSEIQPEGQMQKSWTVVEKKDLKSKIGALREGATDSNLTNKVKAKK